MTTEPTTMTDTQYATADARVRALLAEQERRAADTARQPVTVDARLMAAVDEFAAREGISAERAVERLIGYGLRAVADSDRLSASVEPHPYRVEQGVFVTDDAGDTTVSEWRLMIDAPTHDVARERLIDAVVAEQREEPTADELDRIRRGMLGMPVWIGDGIYRIVK